MSVKVPIARLQRQMIDLLKSRGHSATDAETIADVVMYAELRKNNQGIIKLVKGALDANPSQGEITMGFETPVSGKLLGGHRLGICVVKRATELAIAKAKSVGIGIVGCSDYASATGAIGYWSNEITKENLIAFVCSQCPEMVAPHGSYEPIFGTNPLSIGIPTQPFPLVLDMATSSYAWFGLEMAAAEGKPIASDIAYDNTGHPTTNPVDAMKGALRSFDRSFKGSHLALMVELLAGAWTGAAMTDKSASKNWGSLVMAIDPKILGCTIEEFRENVKEMTDRVKNAKRLPGESGQLFLPGERGDEVAQKQLEEGSIELSTQIYESFLKVLPHE